MNVVVPRPKLRDTLISHSDTSNSAMTAASTTSTCRNSLVRVPLHLGLLVRVCLRRGVLRRPGDFDGRIEYSYIDLSAIPICFRLFERWFLHPLSPHQSTPTSTAHNPIHLIHVGFNSPHWGVYRVAKGMTAVAPRERYIQDGTREKPSGRDGDRQVLPVVGWRRCLGQNGRSSCPTS